MPGPRYCEPCRRLLSGKDHLAEGLFFTHHTDANSLKEALELHCAICSLAYRQPFQHRPILHGTSGHFFHHDDNDTSVKSMRLYWDWPNTGASEIIFVPWENMLDYSLPCPLSLRTDSSSALDFLLCRYRECKDTHVNCRSPRSKGFPPLRIIDVGESMSSRVHLRNAHGFTDALYTCLSYCWGKTQPLLLTKQTETMLYNGISVSTLPKTLHDAVYVTRILGVRYLWIDSLCIFQDNEADWSHEASRMRLIYSQAVCTIAATSAENSAGGLFFDRDPEALQPLCIELDYTPDSNALGADLLTYPPPGRYWCDNKIVWTENVEWAPLAYRAWVCQERHLSSRIIHFTKSGLFWECHEHKASENYPSGILEWAHPFWSEDKAVLKRELRRLETQSITSPLESTSSGKISLSTDIDAALDRDIYYAWCQFRIAYSSCNLTVETDKLVAVQGIAEHMSDVLGDQLIAGLWRNHLLEDLCWHRVKENAVTCELTKWRAPTWSWASTNGTIWVSLTYRDHRHCPDWRSLSEIHDVDVKCKPSGELENATLSIRCRPISALFRPHGHSERDFKAFGTLTFTNSKVEMSALDAGYPELAIDTDSPSWEESRSVIMVTLQQCLHGAGFSGLDGEILADQFDESEVNESKEGGLRCEVEGLLVVPKCGHQDVFQRVGLFRVSGVDGVIKTLREHQAAEDAVITLV